jgi:molybdate transport system substrate-binding protein
MPQALQPPTPAHPLSRGRILSLLLPLLLFALPACRPSPPADPRHPEPAEVTQLLVAAAADLQFAMEDLVQQFHQLQPEVRLTVSYGSSGNFFAQIVNRAPYDLFFSADLFYPMELEQRDLLLPDSLFTYAIGRLVLWTLHSSPLQVADRGMDALRHPQARKIAIANPAHAPYGRAAEAALRHFNLATLVRSRLVLGENIAQAAHFVQSGAADAGIIALGLALAPPMQKAGTYWEIPLDAYPRMDQGGAIIASTRHPQAARRFRQFVLSPEGQSILARFGFILPEEP